MSKKRRARADSGPGGEEKGTGGDQGKRTRTAALPPAVGPSTKRVIARPEAPRFKPTQIGVSAHDQIQLTNVSSEPVDFWDFMQTVLEPDGKPRPEGDFMISGGETDGDGLAPDESTTIKVGFSPKATHEDDLEKRKTSMRGTKVSILDADGAVAGSFTLHGKAKAPSDETLDRLEANEITSTVRHASTRPRPPKPQSFAQMRLHLMSARDLMKTSERDAAHDLVADVLERMEETARYDQVLETFRSYGLGRQSAQMMVGHAHDQVLGASRRLGGDLTVDMDYVLTSFEVAKEPLQVLLGERANAPTIRAMHDASPAVLAARGVEELGATAKRIVTDAAFAAGFGVGVLEGAGGAIKDLVVGVADVLQMAFGIAHSLVTSGLIGTAIETADKVDGFFDKMPGMINAMGAQFEEGWNNPNPAACGNFRGEVIGYIAAQIAIIIISGGAAAEGVAFASATRWGKVVKIIQALDNAGDIVGWAAKVGRRLPVPRKILDRIREATRRGAPDAAIPPTGHATDATVGSDARSRSDTPETVTPEGDGCFVAGSTVVTTSGLRAIENLRIGMRVLASDPETRTQAVHAITRTFVHEVPALLDLAIGGTTITCSPAHPFWVVGRGWTSAGSLYSGDKLVSQGGDELPLDAITRRSGAFTVYNITVESLSTYHVSESRVLVHNKPAHLDEEAAFRSRKDGIYETVQELGERLEKIRSHATTDAQKAALKRFENDIRTLEQQANGATYPSRLTDDDSNFDSFDRIETLETRALKRMEALEKELTPKRKIPADRPARDHETILADGTGSFTRTGKTFQGRQIYRDEGGRLYYVDNLHEGAASEIEVFSSTGKHVGTMSVDGVFNPDGKVDGRYLNKDLL